MSYKTDVQLKAQVDTVIKVNGNREITPPLHNSIETNIIDSKLNIAGGNVLLALLGYSTELTPSDDKHLTTKKYVDDADALLVPLDGSVPMTSLSIEGTGNSLLSLIQSVSGGANNPAVKFMHSNGDGMAIWLDDGLSDLNFGLDTAIGGVPVYKLVRATGHMLIGGTSDSTYQLDVQSGNFRIYSGSSVFNDAGASNNFQVKSENDDYAFFVDGTNDKVGIGVSNPAAKLSANQATLGNEVFRLESTSTNDDPVVKVYQNRVATTDATVATIHTVTIPASTTVGVSGVVVARRTGGVAGSAEDGAMYEFKAAYKNVAGTATLIGSSTITAIAEDQAAWDLTLVPSSGNVLIRVTGAVDNNITWHLSELKTYSVGS
jgi:hypothetical protein